MAYDIGAESRISVLRDFLAQLPPEQFDMTSRSVYLEWPDRIVHKDGSAVCLAGWAERLFGRPHDSDDVVAAHLGLSPEQGQALFYPPNFFTVRRTRSEAIQTLDHLMATGEIAWPDASAPSKPPASNARTGIGGWLSRRLAGPERQRQAA